MVGDAIAVTLQEIDQNPELKPSTKRFRRKASIALLKSWPEKRLRTSFPCQASAQAGPRALPPRKARKIRLISLFELSAAFLISAAGAKGCQSAEAACRLSHSERNSPARDDTFRLRRTIPVPSTCAAPDDSPRRDRMRKDASQKSLSHLQGSSAFSPS